MKKGWSFYLEVVNVGICITVLLIIIGVKLFFPYDYHAHSLSQNLEKAKNQVTQARFIDENVCKDFDSEFEDYGIFYKNHSEILDVTDNYSGVFKGWNIENGYVYETLVTTHDDMEFSATYVFEKTSDIPVANFYRGVNDSAIEFKKRMDYNS